MSRIQGIMHAYQMSLCWNRPIVRKLRTWLNMHLIYLKNTNCQSLLEQPPVYLICVVLLNLVMLKIIQQTMTTIGKEAISIKIHQNMCLFQHLQVKCMKDYVKKSQISTEYPINLISIMTHLSAKIKNMG